MLNSGSVFLQTGKQRPFTTPLTSGLIEQQYVTKVSADYGHLVLSDIQESSKHIRCGMSTVFPVGCTLIRRFSLNSKHLWFLH